jgi:hypothetical protein
MGAVALLTRGGRQAQQFVFRTRRYLYLAVQMKRADPENFNLWDIIRFFPAWQLSFLRFLRREDNPYPQITFAAIELLNRVLTREMRVYEYGAGASTLFFARRVKEIISTEHNAPWYHQVVEMVRKYHYENCHIRLYEPVLDPLLADKDPSDPWSYTSRRGDFHGQFHRGYSFKSYVTSIDDYPDASFDVVLIDGRARSSCFRHAIAKVKVGGYLVWDNTECPDYLPAIQSAPSYLRSLNLPPGPTPANPHEFGKTSVWVRTGLE